MTHSNGNGTLQHRLEVEDWHPPAPPGGAAAARKLPEQDLITRPRDGQGNRLTTTKAWDVPHIKAPAEQSRVRALVDQFDPITSAYVSYRHELLFGAYQNYVQVRTAVDEAGRREQQRAVQLNGQIDQQKEGLLLQAQQSAETLTAERALWEERLEQAHQQAATSVAAAGGCYEPQKPDAEAIFGAPLQSREQVLDQEQLPDPGVERQAQLPGWLTYPATALVGSLIGVSLGLLMGALNPATLLRHWTSTLVFCLVGLAPALFMRAALKLAFLVVGENDYLRRPLWAHALNRMGALGLALAFALIDCMVEYHGLLKLARLDAGLSELSGKSAQVGNTLAYMCVAAIVTLGYLAYSAYEGWFIGRSQVIENRTRRCLLDAQQTHRDSRLERPETRQALEAVAQVRKLSAEWERKQQRLQQTQQEYLQRLAALEAGRPTLSELPSLELRHQLQDAHDNLLGAQLHFDQLIDQLCGVGLPWYARLWRSLFARQRTHDVSSR